MAELLRPVRGGFLRPFGCAWFIWQFLLGNGPHGSPLIDPEVGAPTWMFDPGYVVEGLAAAPAVEGRQVVFATNGGNLYSLVTPLAANDDLRAGWPSGRLSSHAEAPRTYRAAKAVTAREPREKRVPVSNVPLDKPAEDAPLVPEDIERPR